MACRPHIVIRKGNCRFLVGGNCSRDAYHRMEWCQRIPFAFKLCSGSTAEVQMSFNHRPCARQAAAGTDVEVTSELIGAGGFAAKLKLESLSTWSDLVEGLIQPRWRGFRVARSARSRSSQKWLTRRSRPDTRFSNAKGRSTCAE
jgi:hypothetical protein